MYLRCDLIGCFACRRIGFLVLGDVTGQHNQVGCVVAVAVSDRGGAILKEIQW